MYRYFTEQTYKFVKEMNKRPIVWQEVYSNFGNTMGKDTIVHVWMSPELIARATNDGFNILVSTGWYLDHLGNSWDKYYSNDLFKGINNDKQKKLVLGGEACMWSETIDYSVLDATVWPKAAATSERLWSDATINNINKAKDRVKYFRCLLIRRGVGAGPVNNVESRKAPPKQDSCFNQ